MPDDFSYTYGTDAWSSYGSSSAYGPGSAYGISSGSLPGSAIPKPAATSKPARTDRPVILTSGAWSRDDDAAFSLTRSIDDVIARLGPAVYDMMMTDDQVKSSVDTYAFAVMGGEFDVEPAVVADEGEIVEDPKRQADIELAAKLADQQRRSYARVPDILDQFEAMFMLGVVRGSGLCDPSWTTVKEEGDDRPVTLLDSLQCRPPGSWEHVVDRFGKPIGVYAMTDAGPAYIPRERVMVHVNAMRNGDPRGTSDLRCVYDPWNFKIAARPQKAKWLDQFATGTVIVTYTANVGDVADELPDGTTVYLTPQQQAERIASGFSGGSWMALPEGWTAQLIESKNDGGAFRDHEDDCNKAIAKGILLTARVTNESDRNSSADAYASQDVFQLKIEPARKDLCRSIEQGVHYQQAVLNHGKAVADRFTPKAVFRPSKSIHADIWTAVTAVLNTKEIPNRVKPKLFAMANLPATTVEDFEEMERKAEEAADKANAAKVAQQGAAMQGQGATKNGEDANDDGGKPTAVGNKPQPKAKPAKSATDDDE